MTIEFWALAFTILGSVGASTTAIWYRIGGIEGRLSQIEGTDKRIETQIERIDDRVRKLEAVV